MPAARALGRSVLFAGASAVVILVALRLANTSIDGAPHAVESAPLDLLDPSLVQTLSGFEIVATETLARPVFSPSRRPASAPAEPAPASVPIETSQPLELTLAGVMISDAGRQALLVSPAAPSGEWVEVGSEVGGWRLVSVEAGSVEVTSPAGSRTIQLYVDNAPPL